MVVISVSTLMELLHRLVFKIKYSEFTFCKYCNGIVIIVVYVIVLGVKNNGIRARNIQGKCRLYQTSEGLFSKYSLQKTAAATAIDDVIYYADAGL